jgi:hypothetical protein
MPKVKIQIANETIFGIHQKWLIIYGPYTVEHNGSLRETFHKFCNKSNTTFKEEVYQALEKVARQTVPSKFHRYI